jgi:putative flippase GtrA
MQPKLMATAAMLFASVFNIAFSFLTYKWFVFKTRGNYLKEYLRSLLVYLPSIAVNTMAVAPLSVALNHLNTPIERLTNITNGSVYLASILLLGTTFILSFFGHKHISFRGSANPERIPQSADDGNHRAES